MATLLSVLIIMLVLLVILFIKNKINYKIQIQWVDEVYNDKISEDSVLEWSMIPEYTVSLLDPFLWKYKPLKEYLKIS